MSQLILMPRELRIMTYLKSGIPSISTSYLIDYEKQLPEARNSKLLALNLDGSFMDGRLAPNVHLAHSHMSHCLNS